MGMGIENSQLAMKIRENLYDFIIFFPIVEGACEQPMLQKVKSSAF